MRRTILVMALILGLGSAGVAAQETSAPPKSPEAVSTPPAILADRPPMGWNSWDSYGLTINESDYKANVKWLHQHLQPYGWQYAVIDEGWYLKNPASGGKPAWEYTVSKDGRYLPAVNRF